MQVSIRCREVNGHGHVDVPASLEIVHEAWLLHDLKLGELDRPSRFKLSFLIDQFSLFVFFLVFDLFR